MVGRREIETNEVNNQICVKRCGRQVGELLGLIQEVYGSNPNSVAIPEDGGKHRDETCKWKICEPC